MQTFPKYQTIRKFYKVEGEQYYPSLNLNLRDFLTQQHSIEMEKPKKVK